MNTCYQLIGLPASGKSTWARDNKLLLNATVISSDEYIECYAEYAEKTYSEVFDYVIYDAIEAMVESVIEASFIGQDIIWDQTSVSVKSRSKKFKMLPHYRHVAVVFPEPEPIELRRRLDSRPGKIISDAIVQSLRSKFVMPTLKEGFSDILIVDK